MKIYTFIKRIMPHYVPVYYKPKITFLLFFFSGKCLKTCRICWCLDVANHHHLHLQFSMIMISWTHCKYSTTVF